MKLLLEREAEVNTVTLRGNTVLTLASQEGHSDVVKLLLEREAEVNTVTENGSTALMVSSQNGHWDIAKILIDANAIVSQVNQYKETAFMYLIFAEITNKYNIQLGNIVEIWQNPLSPESHYAMPSASFALIGALICNTTSELFDSDFAKSALQEYTVYAFLPTIFHQYSKSNEHLFSCSVEEKISLHTMSTAVVCKLPYTALQWLTPCHRDKLVNMLGQTPLHLLAMENRILCDMEEKILLVTKTVGFSFSDRDNNGRVPYHIACIRHNTQFLLCGLKLDSDYRTNILVRDHLGKIPLTYMTYLLKYTAESGVQALKFIAARKTHKMLIEHMGLDLAMHTQLNICTDPVLSNNTVDSLSKYFTANMTVTELIKITTEAKKILFGTGDVASLFACNARGIVRLPDKQQIVVSVIHLLQLIGTEMGRMDPLFECVPELKGSVQEYTKCGKLDELDTSMKLVNFTDYFSMHLSEYGIKIHAEITQTWNRYWISGERDRFSSIEFCADFWQICLKVLDTDVIRTYMKGNSLIIENCERKHGFVGMLNISCKVGDSNMLISVDITPSIVCNNLKEYTALLRPRHYDNKEIGDKFYTGLELSSSHKDWDFLRFLQPEVMCAYALVKMLRSVAKTFQTEKGKVYTAEDILPSYMVKTGLLWILDPEEKCFKIYTDLNIGSIFQNEDSSSYKGDVLGLCQDLLHDTHTSGIEGRDLEKLRDICKKCCTATGHLTVRERIPPYVLDTRRSDRQEQNGINLQWMNETWKPEIEGILHQDEIIYNRKLYSDPEAERVWVEYNSDTKPAGQLSHHKIAYPDINEDTVRKCRVWALRMLWILPHLLKYDGQTPDGKAEITGVRNYYLPDQEIYARDKDLAVALCRVLQAVLE